jgi:hypothetical protein
LYPSMKKFWDSIIEKKLDLTEFGYWSGSGLVKFN